MEGLHKIVAIKASINQGLTEKLKTAFPNITPIQIPQTESMLICDPQWLAGFTSGVGCLIVTIRKSSTHRVGLQVELVFQINQHFRDEQLIINLV